MNENMTNGAMALSDYDLDAIMGGMMGIQNPSDYAHEDCDNTGSEMKRAYGVVAQYMSSLF